MPEWTVTALMIIYSVFTLMIVIAWTNLCLNPRAKITSLNPTIVWVVATIFVVCYLNR